MASFQAPAASGSELPLAISGEEVAARQTAGLFAPALGPISSHRLMPGSGSATTGAGREHGGLSNEPTYSSVGREMMVRGEDFVGLYTGLGRLSGALEGGSSTLSSTNPGLMNVGATGIARAGAKQAMVSFVGGEFRLQGMGRGMEEEEGEGMTSMQPLVSSMSRRAGHEAEGEAAARGEPSWQQGDPNVHELFQRGRSAHEQQEMQAEARGSIKESSGLMMGGGAEHHHHQQQRAAAQANHLALVRVNEGGERGRGELEQHQRLLEQRVEQQQARELMMRSQREIGTGGATAGGGGSTACYDCGNQAKKDCLHMRCRTCCKSRGFDCATHVKSTWVPVSKRRQRLQQQGLLNPSMTASGEQQQQYQESLKLARLKRARTLSLTAGGGSSSTMAGAAHHAGAAAAPSHTSTSTGTPPRSSDINSAPPAAPTLSQAQAQVRSGLFPPEFRTQAVFKCVRITGMTDGQEEYAYQTEVRIGGHIFKGILHDQGAEKPDFATSNIAELQLGGRNIQSSTAALMDLSGMYASGGNAMLGSAFR